MLLGAVIGNRWWDSLKYRIRDFAIKYGQKLKLDKAKKGEEGKISRAVERGDSLVVELARRDLEREVSERHGGFVVRSRLKRVPNETVKCNSFAREGEARRFPRRYIESIKSPDEHVLRSNHELHEAFRVNFRDRFARLLDFPL